MELTEPQRRTLEAVVDQIIPPDDFPGAAEAGVGDYIMRQMNGDCRDEADLIRGGVSALAAANFAQRTADQQRGLLADLEAGRTPTDWPVDPRRFFRRLVELTAEGYYSDPGNGGNRHGVAWRMVGYVPNDPRAYEEGIGRA